MYYDIMRKNVLIRTGVPSGCQGYMCKYVCFLVKPTKSSAFHSKVATPGPLVARYKILLLVTNIGQTSRMRYISTSQLSSAMHSFQFHSQDGEQMHQLETFVITVTKQS